MREGDRKILAGVPWSIQLETTGLRAEYPYSSPGGGRCMAHPGTFALPPLSLSMAFSEELPIGSCACSAYKLENHWPNIH